MGSNYLGKYDIGITCSIQTDRGISHQQSLWFQENQLLHCGLMFMLLYIIGNLCHQWVWPYCTIYHLGSLSSMACGLLVPYTIGNHFHQWLVALWYYIPLGIFAVSGLWDYGTIYLWVSLSLMACGLMVGILLIICVVGDSGNYFLCCQQHVIIRMINDFVRVRCRQEFFWIYFEYIYKNCHSLAIIV